MKKPTSSPAAAPEKTPRRRWLPTLLALLICAGIFAALLLTAGRGRVHEPQSTVLERITYEKAEVVNISVDTVQPNPDNPDGLETGKQQMLIRLLSGPHAGELYELTLYVATFQGPKLAEGDTLTVAVDNAAETGEVLQVSFYHHDRVGGVWLVFGLFVLVTVLVGGWRGVKSLLGLALTVILLIFVFCPLLMKGYEPVRLSFALCVFVAVFCFVILSGLGRKTLCAVGGTVAGTGLAALFGILSQSILRINGYSMYDVNSELSALVNLQTMDFDVHITGLITAGVIIASLGAVMDVAMSLSSALSELRSVNPTLGFRQLFRSGMNVGRDMVGTMTNTLILAFVGTSLVSFLYLWSLGPGYRQLLSSAYFSVELCSALSSSVGVILSVPLTALIGAAVYGKRK